MTEEKQFDWSYFRIMGSSEQVNLISHAQNYLKKNPDCEVHVGCDSQNVRGITIYVTTVVFRHEGQGAHVIYKKEKLDRIKDMWSKLWAETERSVDLANHLSNDLGIKISQIDLDYNTDPAFKSHGVYTAATGYVSSLGYVVKAKPNLLMAVWAANALCG
ncbi:MAG: putative RNase H-related nuclease YkuK (DUF458 family) [Patiriisocius sp.]|jgi:predicted RNase H-related nuclease YkuK (DUF458 family)